MLARDNISARGDRGRQGARTPFLTSVSSAGATFTARRTRMKAAGKSAALGSCGMGAARGGRSCTHTL